MFNESCGHRASLVTAQVMQWHFDQLEGAHESYVFAPLLGQAPSRTRRKAWLQDALLAALHLSETEARRLMVFHAGLAGDLLRAGVAPQSIAIWCRWWSMRAMRLYADRQELCVSRTSVGRRLFNGDH